MLPDFQLCHMRRHAVRHLSKFEIRMTYEFCIERELAPIHWHPPHGDGLGVNKSRPMQSLTKFRLLLSLFTGPCRSSLAHAALRRFESTCERLRARAHCLCSFGIRPRFALGLAFAFSVSDPYSTLCPDQYSFVCSLVFVPFFFPLLRVLACPCHCTLHVHTQALLSPAFGTKNIQQKLEYRNVNFEPKCSLTVHENP